jgi:restriction system protein
MSIWKYQNHVEDKQLIEEGLYLSACLFCSTNMITLRDYGTEHKEESSKHIQVAGCPTCGWWKFSERIEGWDGNLKFDEYYGAVASLRNLDLADMSTPIDEVKRFLAAKYKARHDVHPRLFEETVASVFRGLGYHAKVTAYSGDGGIDIILEGRDNKEIGVQVKRYKGSIGVEQIRSLAGALLLGGYTKGIFVTTSHFQSGAGKVALQAALRGIQIELIDAERFFDALKIVQRENYETSQDLIMQVGRPSLVLLERLEEEW